MCFLFLCVASVGYAEEWNKNQWKEICSKQNRVALLVYQEKDYAEAKENAQAMQYTLSYLGFSVGILSNPSQEQLQDAIQLFHEAPKTDLSLFYYAGDGGTRDGENVILSIDEQWIPITSLLETAPKGNRLVLLDADRKEAEGIDNGWMMPKTIAPNVLFSMATAPTMLYAQQPRYISSYVEELTIWLPRADLSIQAILKNVHRNIKKRTQNAQIPVLVDDTTEPISFWAQSRTVQEFNIPVERIHTYPFQMGCTEKQSRTCDEDELPVHTVSIPRDFWMMTSEVTMALYEQVLSSHSDTEETSQNPIDHVSWRDAIRFANRLSALEGRERCYVLKNDHVLWTNPHCSGWRLPTEEEWEYAARAQEQFIFSGGDFLPEVAWFASNSKRRPQPVCTKKKNGFGLCDMSGNVWEWVYDSYQPYQSDTYTNTSLRVLRGGSWFYTSNVFRVSKRFALPEKGRCDDCGFRLVRY